MNSKYIDNKKINGSLFGIILLKNKQNFNTLISLFMINYKNNKIIYKENLNDKNEDLKHILSNKNNVFLFNDAKQSIRILLNKQLNVRRVICLKTLNQLNIANNKNNQIIYIKNLKDAEKKTKQNLEIFANILINIEKHGLIKIAQIECYLTTVFANMEYNGFPILVDKWKKIIDNKKKELYKYEIESKKYLSKVLQKNLFGEVQINLKNDLEVKNALEKIIGKKLINFNKTTLKLINLKEAKSILHYRNIAEIINKYGCKFLIFCNKSKNRVFGKFKSLGTSTGRVSSYNPNLQNLPLLTSFHKCICVPLNKILICADYSACELRILAGLSGDPVLIKAFFENKDIHSEIANELFNNKVSKNKNNKLRKIAKIISFSIIYGISAKGLAYNLKISTKNAQIFLNNYFKSFPKIKNYLENNVKQAKINGFAKTVLGRKLIFNNQKHLTNMNIQKNSRIAKNMPIQGTAADIIKLAILHIHDSLIENFKNAYIVNMIHDELLIECLKEDTQSISLLLKTKMEKAQQIIIPNVKPYVDIKIGRTWEI